MAWTDTDRTCPRCGDATLLDGGGRELHCPACTETTPRRRRVSAVRRRMHELALQSACDTCEVPEGEQCSLRKGVHMQRVTKTLGMPADHSWEAYVRVLNEVLR